MAKSETVSKVIRLGNLLVKELGLEDSNDTLSRWMANYISEQIQIVETTKGKAKEAAEQKCMETILAVWKNRWELQPNFRPFRNFERILETIEQLNPERTIPYYYPDFYEQKKPEENSALAAVGEIDKAARLLLFYVLLKAARESSDSFTPEWLEATEDLGSDADVLVIRKMLSNGYSRDFANLDNYSDHGHAKLESHLRLVELLEKHAKALKAEIKAEIKKSKSKES